MTEQEQRIALREWMGWYPCRCGSNRCIYDECQNGTRKDSNSLDVLHEMEKRLKGSEPNEQQFSNYLSALAVIVNSFDTDCLMVAEASERREALCRTLWPERFKACADQADPAP